jgi:hypothetical protein
MLLDFGAADERASAVLVASEAALRKEVVDSLPRAAKKLSRLNDRQVWTFGLPACRSEALLKLGDARGES